jgi:predicted esterase
MKTIGIFILLFPVLISCTRQTDVSEKSELIHTTCNADTLHTYELYIPAHPSGCSLLPLFVILDPHGSGNYALENFIESAEKYKCILAASNLLRNNMENYIPSLRLLIDDIRSKYPVSSIYLAGFSGGARMALTYAAMNNTVEGVVACGALLPDNELNMVNTAVFAIIGMADFNFMEYSAYIFNENAKPKNMNLLVTSNQHEWPSSADLSVAVGTLLFKKKELVKCLPAETEKEFVAAEKEKINRLMDEKCYVQANLSCKNMLSVKSLSNRKFFKSKLNELENDLLLTISMNNLRRSIQFEQNIRQAYSAGLFTKDTTWWKNEVNELNNQINRGGERHLVFTYKRIKGFLGILCYSFTKNSLEAGDLEKAKKVLDVYRIVEPENTDLAFFSAIYLKKSGKQAAKGEME